jgi:hypoxanthine phosphoribosyltransferase
MADNGKSCRFSIKYGYFQEMMNAMEPEGISVLIPADRIRARIGELGKAITDDYAGADEIVVVCVLKGAFIFAADLVRQIGVPCRIDFIRASSYGTHCNSSGRVLINHDLDIEGRKVLLVEDIVDTGLTLSCIRTELMKLAPESLKACCLLDKPSARKVPAEADYVAFTIPDIFIAGYGLDVAGRHRELPYIGIPAT